MNSLEAKINPLTGESRNVPFQGIKLESEEDFMRADKAIDLAEAALKRSVTKPDGTQPKNYEWYIDRRVAEAIKYPKSVYTESAIELPTPSRLSRAASRIEDRYFPNLAAAKRSRRTIPAVEIRSPDGQRKLEALEVRPPLLRQVTNSMIARAGFYLALNFATVPVTRPDHTPLMAVPVQSMGDGSLGVRTQHGGFVNGGPKPNLLPNR